MIDRTIRVLQFVDPYRGNTLIRVNVDYPDRPGPGITLIGDDWRDHLTGAVHIINDRLRDGVPALTVDAVLGTEIEHG